MLSMKALVVRHVVTICVSRIFRVMLNEFQPSNCQNVEVLGIHKRLKIPNVTFSHSMNNGDISRK